VQFYFLICIDMKLSLTLRENSNNSVALSETELYLSSDHRLLAKLAPTFADIMVSRSQRGRSPTAVISVF
jgi:hypothetical protein